MQTTHMNRSCDRICFSKFDFVMYLRAQSSQVNFCVSLSGISVNFMFFTDDGDWFIFSESLDVIWSCRLIW